MDKRNIIFIFILTMVFFGANQYFSKKGAEKKAEQTQVVTESLSTPHQDVSAQVAPIQSFPLTQIYKDKATSEELMLSLNFGMAFLSSIDTKDLPKVAYVKQKGKVQEAHLVYHSDLGLAYYSTKPEAPLTTTFIPQVGSTPLQMVSLEGGSPIVTIGEYSNGSLNFPVKVAKSDAIALYEMDGSFMPIGYYNSQKKSFHFLSEFSDLKPLLSFKQSTQTRQVEAQEQFYVLQNDTQQIVFSTVGGAIAEINLPFESKTNSESVVKEINFDRVIDKEHATNSLFPLKPYQIAKSTGQASLEQPAKGGYYPLLRRDLKSQTGKSISDITPNFYALSVISEDEKITDAIFKMKRFTDTMIEFESIQKNRRITKKYWFPKDASKTPYCLNASIRVEGDARGLWVNTGIPEVELVSRNSNPVLKYRSLNGSKSKVEKISLPKNSTMIGSINPYWIANTNGFFGIILDPLSEVKPGIKASLVPGTLAPSRLTLIDSQYDLYPANKYPGYELMLPLLRDSSEVSFRLYAGPLEESVLATVDKAYSEMTGSNPEYTAARSFHGFFSFISEPFSRFLYVIMKLFYSFTHSWGFSIILLTIVLRLLMYPLNAWSFKSTARMQLLSPKLKVIQEKFKKDPKRLQMEMMKLYKVHKANPFSGCLPLLIQMPFLFGMFDLLKSTFGLRGASFIPGWINDLAAPDVVFSWSYPIFFIGNSFHLLPFILGGIMFVQQKVMTKMKSGEISEQQKQQQKMGTIMTIGFTFLFYHFPSGLNIYWISSSLLGILQQWYTNKTIAEKGLSPVKTK